MEAPRVGGEDLAEPLGAQAERLWAEMRELGLGLRGCEEPDAGALLRPASVRTSCRPPSNTRRKAGCFGPRSPYRSSFSRPAVIRWTRTTARRPRSETAGACRALDAREPAALQRPKAAGQRVFMGTGNLDQARPSRSAPPTRARRASVATPPSRVALAPRSAHGRRAQGTRAPRRHGRVGASRPPSRCGTTSSRSAGTPRSSYLRSAAKPLRLCARASGARPRAAGDRARLRASHPGAPGAARRRPLAAAAGRGGEDDLGAGSPASLRRGSRTTARGEARPGMLLLARSRGWETAGYRLQRHPRAAGRALDGCGRGRRAAGQVGRRRLRSGHVRATARADGPSRSRAPAEARRRRGDRRLDADAIPTSSAGRRRPTR